MEQDSIIELPHLPQYPVHISLFKGVQNSAYLREQLLATNAEFEYGFVDAETVINPSQLPTPSSPEWSNADQNTRSLDFIREPGARGGLPSNQ